MNKNTMFIRGARVVQQLEEASSFPKLMGNIERGFPNTAARQHLANQPQIQSMQFIPAVANGVLEVRSKVQGQRDNYNPVVQFLNTQYQDADTANNVTFVATDGKEYHIVPVHLTDTNVKVSCDCMDFYFRFAAFNHGDESLSGALPPLYQRKTNTYPPANPMQVPGICKHLIKLFNNLEQRGICY